MNLSNKYRNNLLMLTAAGLFVRLLWVINLSSNPVSDFAAYHNLALSVFNNETSNFLGFQGPGYPLVLGFYYKLIGTTSIFSAKIFNLILSIITMIILLKIITKLFNNKKYIYISYGIVVFLPNYIAYNNILATEPLNLFLFSIIILLQIYDKTSILKYCLLGILIGFVSLVKPYMIIYPIIAALSLYLKHKDFKTTIKFLIIVQFACLIVIAPWTYRNYKVYNDFVTISYNNGYVMYINNNDQNKGGWMSIADVHMTDETKNAIKDAGYTYDEAVSSFNTRLNKVFKNEAVKWIKSNPLKFAVLSFKRVIYTFFSGAGDIFAWSMNGDNSSSLFYLLASSSIFRTLANSIVVFLSLCGLIFAAKNLIIILKALFTKGLSIDYIISIPFFNIAFAVMLSVVYEGQPRYNFTTLFMFIICLCVLTENLKNGKKISQVSALQS